jgi:hypothetical protein
MENKKDVVTLPVESTSSQMDDARMNDTQVAEPGQVPSSSEIRVTTTVSTNDQQISNAKVLSNVNRSSNASVTGTKLGSRTMNKLQSVQNSNEVRSVKTVHGLQSVQNATEIQSVKTEHGLQSVQTATEVQTVQRAKEVQTFKTASNVQSFRTANNVRSDKIARELQSASHTADMAGEVQFSCGTSDIQMCHIDTSSVKGQISASLASKSTDVVILPVSKKPTEVPVPPARVLLLPEIFKSPQTGVEVTQSRGILHQMPEEGAVVSHNDVNGVAEKMPEAYATMTVEAIAAVYSAQLYASRVKEGASSHESEEEAQSVGAPHPPPHSDSYTDHVYGRTPIQSQSLLGSAYSAYEHIPARDEDTSPVAPHEYDASYYYPSCASTGHRAMDMTQSSKQSDYAKYTETANSEIDTTTKVSCSPSSSNLDETLSEMHATSYVFHQMARSSSHKSNSAPPAEAADFDYQQSFPQLARQPDQKHFVSVAPTALSSPYSYSIPTSTSIVAICEASRNRQTNYATYAPSSMLGNKIPEAGSTIESDCYMYQNAASSSAEAISTSSRMPHSYDFSRLASHPSKDALVAAVPTTNALDYSQLGVALSSSAAVSITTKSSVSSGQDPVSIEGKEVAAEDPTGQKGSHSTISSVPNYGFPCVASASHRPGPAPGDAATVTASVRKPISSVSERFYGTSLQVSDYGYPSSGTSNQCGTSSVAVAKPDVGNENVTGLDGSYSNNGQASNYGYASTAENSSSTSLETLDSSYSYSQDSSSSNQEETSLHETNVASDLESAYYPPTSTSMDLYSNYELLAQKVTGAGIAHIYDHVGAMDHSYYAALQTKATPMFTEQHGESQSENYEDLHDYKDFTVTSGTTFNPNSESKSSIPSMASLLSSSISNTVPPISSVMFSLSDTVAYAGDSVLPSSKSNLTSHVVSEGSRSSFPTMSSQLAMPNISESSVLYQTVPDYTGYSSTVYTDFSSDATNRGQAYTYQESGDTSNAELDTSHTHYRLQYITTPTDTGIDEKNYAQLVQAGLATSTYIPGKRAEEKVDSKSGDKCTESNATAMPKLENVDFMENTAFSQFSNTPSSSQRTSLPQIGTLVQSNSLKDNVLFLTPEGITSNVLPRISTFTQSDNAFSMNQNDVKGTFKDYILGTFPTQSAEWKLPSVKKTEHTPQSSRTTSATYSSPDTTSSRSVKIERKEETSNTQNHLKTVSKSSKFADASKSTVGERLPKTIAITNRSQALKSVRAQKSRVPSAAAGSAAQLPKGGASTGSAKRNDTPKASGSMGNAKQTRRRKSVEPVKEFEKRKRTEVITCDADSTLQGDPPEARLRLASVSQATKEKHAKGFYVHLPTKLQIVKPTADDSNEISSTVEVCVSPVFGLPGMDGMEDKVWSASGSCGMAVTRPVTMATATCSSTVAKKADVGAEPAVSFRKTTVSKETDVAMEPTISADTNNVTKPSVAMETDVAKVTVVSGNQNALMECVASTCRDYQDPIPDPDVPDAEPEEKPGVSKSRVGCLPKKSTGEELGKEEEIKVLQTKKLGKIN